MLEDYFFHLFFSPVMSFGQYHMNGQYKITYQCYVPFVWREHAF